ncbi:MAG: hypothetical protein COB46_02675 [Rhodospirillaceae bacterium]|nr:MAG: hypothetical protein COB46_02675 [Rhodospirillaceae bacterium]
MFHNALKIFAALVLILCISAPLSVQAGQEIAEVTRLKHSASLIRNGVEQALHLNSKLHADDIISTQDATRLEITFSDGTVLILGEQANLTLDDFVYDPQNSSTLSVSVTQGAFLFVSGLMAKQNDRDMKVTTPLATIGIRGTTFWGGALDNPLDVLLLDGKIDVVTLHGSVLLDEDGKGTTVSSPNQAPTDPIFWPKAKRQRAFATVAF